MGEFDRTAIFIKAGPQAGQTGRAGADHEIHALRPAFAVMLGLIMLHGPKPIPGHGFTRDQRHGLKRFPSMAFDRVPPQLSDCARHQLFPLSPLLGFASALPSRLKLSRMLPNTSGLNPWLRMMVYCWMKVIVLLAIQ